MKRVLVVASSLLALATLLAAAPEPRRTNSTNPVAVTRGQNDEARIEGERRFRANCGRCHAAPQKFPPRVMATVMRHMRVRATITDEDMRLILAYLTQ